jgi:hypothetical protein
MSDRLARLTCRALVGGTRFDDAAAYEPKQGFRAGSFIARLSRLLALLRAVSD